MKRKDRNRYKLFVMDLCVRIIMSEGSLRELFFPTGRIERANRIRRKRQRIQDLMSLRVFTFLKMSFLVLRELHSNLLIWNNFRKEITEQVFVY